MDISQQSITSPIKEMDRVPSQLRVEKGSTPTHQRFRSETQIKERPSAEKQYSTLKEPATNGRRLPNIKIASPYPSATID